MRSVLNKSSAKAELAWRRVKRDPLWTARRLWHIKHPSGKMLFDLRDPQVEALTRWVDGENSITLKARQIGWSTSVGFFAWWIAFTQPDAEILFLSRTERDAMKLLEKVTYGQDRLPEWLRAKGPQIVRQNLQTLEFDNNSSITSLPSKSNPARGFTGRLVVVDEWAFFENAEEAWASIEPVADIGGQIIGLSTANGWGNTFHELWQKAEAGSSTFKPMFFSWRAVPERDDAWYEAKKRDMQVWQLHQEYPDNPREAFIKSGHMVYDPDMLEYQAKEFQKEPLFLGDLVEEMGELKVRGDLNGPLRIWKHPEPLATYAMGVDVAEGLEHGDFSCVQVIRVPNNVDEKAEIPHEVVAEWHGHIDPTELGYVVDRLGRFYNLALVGVEANNHGGTTLAKLREVGYRRLYRERKIEQRGKRPSLRWGWWTSKVSKPVAVDGITAYMREGMRIYSKATIDELFTYVRDGKGGTEGSPFDDRVMALGIAVQMVGYVNHKDYEVEEQDDTFTLEWWIRQAEEQYPKGTEEGDWLIGHKKHTRNF